MSITKKCFASIPVEGIKSLSVESSHQFAVHLAWLYYHICIPSFCGYKESKPSKRKYFRFKRDFKEGNPTSPKTHIRRHAALKIFTESRYLRMHHNEIAGLTNRDKTSHVLYRLWQQLTIFIFTSRCNKEVNWLWVSSQWTIAARGHAYVGTTITIDHLYWYQWMYVKSEKWPPTY